MIPHKNHRVTQWSREPAVGYPRTTWYCWDCGAFAQITLASVFGGRSQ